MSKKMTQKELQQMLDSFQKEVTKKEWEIDRDIHLRSIASDGGKIGGKIGGNTNAKSGHMKRIQKKGCAIGGKVTGTARGKENVESGHIYDIQGKGGESAQKVLRTCPHCHMESKGSLYFKNHGDRCKLKGFIPQIFIDQVKEGRSKSSLAREYGISTTYVNSLIDKFCK